MKVKVFATPAEMAVWAARHCAKYLSEVIARKGSARLLVSTGASQLPFFGEFIGSSVDFSKLEMFHLDEYMGIDDSHPASFKKYLSERFVSRVNLKKAHLIDGKANPAETMAWLRAELAKAPIDLGLIGIGENGHIAFNDPPADFNCDDDYKIVYLNDTCKRQQVREGWFPDMDSVPPTALTMTCRRIMKCEKIVSIVPYAVKAQAVRDTLTQPVNNMIPAGLLTTHPDCTLLLDAESASMVPAERLEALK